MIKTIIIEKSVSIIIPSKDNLKQLKDCISSISEQTFKSYEVWVMDSASTDGTRAYLEELQPPFYWKSEPDKGIYDAMNKGIDLAKGEWLYFLGADDILYNADVLESVFSKEYPEQLKMIIGKVKNKMPEGFTANKTASVPSLWSSKIWLKNTLHHQALFYHKDLFLTNRYSLEYKVLADYDLNLNLYKKKVQKLILPQTIALCGMLGFSKRNDWQMYREEIKIKSSLSSELLRPLFYLLALVKYNLNKWVKGK